MRLNMQEEISDADGKHPYNEQSVVKLIYNKDD